MLAKGLPSKGERGYDGILVLFWFIQHRLNLLKSLVEGLPIIVAEYILLDLTGDVLHELVRIIEHLEGVAGIYERTMAFERRLQPLGDGDLAGQNGHPLVYSLGVIAIIRSYGKSLFAKFIESQPLAAEQCSKTTAYLTGEAGDLLVYIRELVLQSTFTLHVWKRNSQEK